MLRFQHINYLLALGILPLLVLLFVWLLFWRKNKLKKIGNERLVSEQMLGFIPGRITLKFIFLCIAFGAAVIGWANLQMGAKTDKIHRKGVDVMIALDVSKSMLAKDIQPDRLTRAKQLITRMLDKMENDRVGLVIFAGRAYLQVPLTLDYNAMKMLLQSVRPDLIPTQGTVISDAITLSTKSFSQKEKKFKSLIIISDGEDHDENAIAVTKAAADEGVIVHTIGIGSPQGSTLYDPQTGAVKLDENGNPVISKLNEAELQTIAASGRGTYTYLSNTDVAASKLIDEIEGMEQKNLGAVVFTDYTSYFQYFLACAFILLIIEWFLPGSRFKNKRGIKANKIVAVLIFFFLSTMAAQAQEKKLLKQGNKLYQQKKYKEATNTYLKAIQKNPNSSTGLFNLGNALYQQKQLDAARKAMTASASQSKNDIQKSSAQYNVGNTYMSEQKWEDAIAAYKQALRNNPQDADAKYNLSYAEEMLKKQQQDNKNNKNKDQQKQNQQQQKQQQDKDKQDKQKQEQQKQDQSKEQEKQKENQQQSQSQPSKLSKEQADQILNALRQEEKNLQDKKKNANAIPVKLDKDW